MIYIHFSAVFGRWIYILIVFGNIMEDEYLKRIEEMIKNAVKQMFDENYCPHGSECRFCREDNL
tara:strand:+ start:991 stop:1182 length:192 start_codon:yes stop_codon:yes gene_type:complete